MSTIVFKIKEDLKWESLFSPHWHLLCAEPSAPFENEIFQRLVLFDLCISFEFLKFSKSDNLSLSCVLRICPVFLRNRYYFYSKYLTNRSFQNPAGSLSVVILLDYKKQLSHTNESAQNVIAIECCRNI